MKRSDLVLAALAAGGRGTLCNGIRVQVLLFLIETEIAGRVDGPHFDFQSEGYGPYDPAVLHVIDQLEEDGKVVIKRAGPYWTCVVSTSGHRGGSTVLRGLARPARRYVVKASRWVLGHSLWELMFAIRRYFPDMVNDSVIPAALLEDPSGRAQRMRHPFLWGMATLVGMPRQHDGAPSGMTGPEQDALAIASDWIAVGRDLWSAFERVSPVSKSQ